MEYSQPQKAHVNTSDQPNKNITDISEPIPQVVLDMIDKVMLNNILPLAPLPKDK